MNEDRRQKESEVAELDGAIAELVHAGAIAGWLAVLVAPFRNLFLAKQVGCWLLFTWVDGSMEIEEDYPPFTLLPDLRAGTFRDEDRGADYEVHWVTDDRRGELWERYGVLEDPGHYMRLAATQHRVRR